MLNMYDEPTRDWKNDPGYEKTPRISTLNENNANAHYSVQSLLRLCYSISLHPRLIVYIRHLIHEVEDRVSMMELSDALKEGATQGCVGNVCRDLIQIDKLATAVQRVNSIGIHSAELVSFCNWSTVVLELRTAIINSNFVAAFEVIANCSGKNNNDFPCVIDSIRSQTSIHPVILPEYVLLAFESCDGYWRGLALNAIDSGRVEGNRGCLQATSIGWNQIDVVLSHMSSHWDFSAQSIEVQKMCQYLRTLRSQLLSSFDVQSLYSDLSSVKFDWKPFSKYNSYEKFSSNIVDRAVLTVTSCGNVNHQSSGDLNFSTILETVASLEQLVSNSESISTHFKENILAEANTIQNHVNFLKARAFLEAAAEMQPIWFTEFGLETRDQFISIMQSSIEVGVSQKWDLELPQERWWKRLLDCVKSILVLHSKLKETGHNAVAVGSTSFSEVMPYINGVLNHLLLISNETNQRLGFKKKELPAKLMNLQIHLKSAMNEYVNIYKLQSILFSDKLSCSLNYSGKFTICVVHVTSVIGLNFFTSEYSSYALKLVNVVDNIPVSTFIGQSFRRTVRLYINMRTAVKACNWCDALGLSKIIQTMRGEEELVASLRDCQEVQKYCNFLICRRSLEQGITCCILPPFAGWSDFGAMPLFALSIIDGPLVEAIDKTTLYLSSYKTDFPEIAALMDAGLFFLRLIAAVRSRSWKSGIPPKGSSSLEMGTKHAKMRQSIIGSGSIQRESLVSLDIEMSTLTLLNNMSKTHPQLTSLKTTMMSFGGISVDLAVNALRLFVRSSKLIAPELRHFIYQIASQADTEIRVAEMEEFAVKAFKECKISGSAGDLVTPKNAVMLLGSICERFDADIVLVNECYNLKRAHQTAMIMLFVHTSLTKSNCFDLGKYLCMLSFMGSRKRVVMEQKCEDFIYRKNLDEDGLLAEDETNFKNSINNIRQQLRYASSATAGFSNDQTIESSEQDAFLMETSEELLNCSSLELLRLRDEFFEDLFLLEQHFTFECHYADYIEALETKPAHGNAGELIVDEIVFESLATMAHSLRHFGLVTPTSQVGTLLHDTLMAIYQLRRAQKSNNVELIRSALQQAILVRQTEESYYGIDKDSSPDVDERMLERAAIWGMELVVTEGPENRKFILAAEFEIELATHDLEQRDLIHQLQKGIVENQIFLPQVINSESSISLDLSALLLAETMCVSVRPTCLKAIELQTTAQALLQIRSAVNDKKWANLQSFVESLDIVSSLSST